MKSKPLKRIIIFFICFCVLCSAYALTVNFYILAKEKPNFKTTEEIAELEDIDALLVLGCGIRPDNSPSRMLWERLKTGASVIDETTLDKIILSGDNSGESYNEVAVMKEVSLENGISEKMIICDDNGFSTYESIYNAKNTFGAEKIVIVSQSYHLPRALFIAEKLGLEAYGAKAYLPLYPKQIIWSAREVLARNKDFLKCTLTKQ